MRTLRFSLLISILLITFSATAQDANFVWAQRFGGNLNDNCNSACDMAGNVYRMQGGIAKHSSNGAQQWTITTPYNTQNITFDAAGDLYVTGIYTGTQDMDHGPGSYSLTSAGGVDICIVKLSGSTGNFVWAGSIGSTGSDYDVAIHTDASGNVYLGGSITGVYDVDPGAGALNFTATATDFYISKLNSSGSLQWAKQFSGTSSGWVGAIEPDASNDIYFCGSFTGTMDFDPGPAVSNFSTSSNTDSDMYLCKLDATGNFSWLKQMGATGSDYARHLEIGTNGNFYCSGSFTGLVDFDGGPGTLTLNSGTLTDSFVAEFSSTGTPNWARRFTGISIAAMALDQNNGICMTGQFGGADFDPGPGTFSMTANGSTWPDIYICKISSSGDFYWAKQVGSLNEDGSNSLSVDGSNNIHVAGRFKTSCDFNPNAGSYVLTAFGGNFNYDAFMLKLCQTPAVLGVLGSTTLCAGDDATFSVTVPPNAQVYSWALPAGWTGSSATHSIAVVTGTAGGKVTLIAGNTCGITTRTLSVTVDQCTGIKEQNTIPDVLYPNPSAGTFFLEVSEAGQAGIFNELGQEVMRVDLVSGKNVLEMGEFGKGLYLARVSRAGETRMMKMIVQ